ncbi:uncharacterized protein AMSG_02460 [Thecamonas trahens ATCC 50062]|uniref:Uncharacterized protein n=1 Tax=Thecamonas trahens ATCC 50062 TaxID=461836 RepID=A0A0L0D4Z3_THETB|nr:hypothetical protein AMSG_02460 [Thecamonas trahens ATCC 50062]KNC47442.1 hypothetical protein AMSG_02460 [Thecamonas trahens ATCC 50062]|eukprot:XP_013759379.1 hypothetical protein AMSG_02460 [Thecamonas trahens ATCC 50062]
MSSGDYKYEYEYESMSESETETETGTDETETGNDDTDADSEESGDYEYEYEYKSNDDSSDDDGDSDEESGYEYAYYDDDAGGVMMAGIKAGSGKNGAERVPVLGKSPSGLELDALNRTVDEICEVATHDKEEKVALIIHADDESDGAVPLLESSRSRRKKAKAKAKARAKKKAKARQTGESEPSTTDQEVDKVDVVVIDRKLVDDVASLSSDGMHALRAEAQRVREKYRPDRRPAVGSMRATALWWMLLAAAAIVAAIWIVLPFDMPLVATKDGQDETMSWVVGVGAIAVGLGMLVTSCILLSATTARAKASRAKLVFWLMVGLTVAIFVVNVGVYYVYYSDDSVSQDSLRNENGIVTVISIAVLAILIIPCVVLVRNYYSDLATFEQEFTGSRRRRRSVTSTSSDDNSSYIQV